jgi:hypothetical protein
MRLRKTAILLYKQENQEEFVSPQTPGQFEMWRLL